MIKAFKCMLIITLLIAMPFEALSPINASASENKLYAKHEDYINTAKSEIEKIYTSRSKAFTSLDLNSLPLLFDTSQKYGRWALEHEVRRIKYLNDWGYMRNIKFTEVSSSLNVKKVRRIGNRLRLALTEVCSFNYTYKTDTDPVNNCFSIGLNHGVDLINKNNKWLIYNDWYTDCFEDALSSYSSDLKMPDTSKLTIYDIKNSPKSTEEILMNNPRRAKAVEYADKYYLNYNKKYMNFTGIGGDCTNFASQTLSDKEGGGLKYSGGWYCSGGHGSKAFVNTDAFKNYLIYSGRGRIIKFGTFQNLIKATDYFPEGAISKLIPGDLVAYDKKNNVDHFAVVTAFDSHGYPLVNSHTTDRYHVPWDLGWANSNIKFHLIHTNLH